MDPKRHRGQASRVRRAGLIAGTVMGVVIGATMAAAPSVEATCDHVLELASLAGESVGGSDHAACIHYYADQRAGRGAFGWTWLSWCTWAAQSIPEAGEC